MTKTYDDNLFYEREGFIEVTSAKAILFQADDWDSPEWLPRSQIEIRETCTEDSPAVVAIKGWLLNKNGW